MLRIELSGDVWELTQKKGDGVWTFTINVNEVPTYGGISPFRFSYKSFREYIDKTYIGNEAVEDECMKIEIDEILRENKLEKCKRGAIKVSIVGLMVIVCLILIDFLS